MELIEEARILTGIIPVIDFYPEFINDSSLKNLHVLKTSLRKVSTIEYGTLIARNIQLYGPLDKWEDKSQEKIKKYISKELNTLVNGKKRFSSEFMCLLGRLRFMENKSREEVQTIVEEKYS